MDDKISSIVSVNNDLYYKNFILDWLDSDSEEDDSNLMIVVISNLDSNREADHMQCIKKILTTKWNIICRPKDQSMS
jgi:hypothetical protein